MRNDRKNLIVDLSFQFSLKIIEYCTILEEMKKFVVSNQLLKAGTSIGANIREAQNAESKLDFIHKLKIAVKEADECHYWLELCKFSAGYPNADFLLSENQKIINILSKIISSTKAHIKK
jgi:four helix bundle protein